MEYTATVDLAQPLEADMTYQSVMKQIQTTIVAVPWEILMNAHLTSLIHFLLVITILLLVS